MLSQKNSGAGKHKKSLASIVAGAGLACLTATSLPAMAGAKLEIDDTRWLSVGAGLRTSFNMVEDGAPSGTDDSTDFNVDSIRLYFNGQVHENIKFTFNTEEIFGDGPVDVLDAIAQFEFSKGFNFWMGRMLTPADRIEMNGPYYGLSWNQYTQPLFPSDQGGQAGSYGRDDGATVWGTLDKFQYAIGVFDGVEGFGNHDDDLLFAGRFAYNFLNMEDNPAYYTSSTYYGGLGNVLTAAVAFQSQDGGTGTALTSGDFSGVTFDVLSETVLGSGGVITVEGEYKEFDADYTLNTGTGDGEACFCLFDGESYFVTAAYLIPAQVGMGKFQPYARFVENDPNDGDSSDLTEVGVNYVISGHNARLNFNFGSGDANISGYRGADVDRLSFGVQIQI